MLRIENLRKRYLSDTGPVEALRGVSLETYPGEIFTLLGPSGCGKSTLLRSVAGLETPDFGRVSTDDGKVLFSSEDSINVNTYLRGIGMVFQSYAIWPHMTVFENVAFPLRRGNFKVRKSEVRSSVMKSLEMVRLAHLADRPAPLLSGGQQQRVALARALAYEPNTLLLDEPLSNLDAKLRVTMRDEIQEIIKHLDVTALYVTHDQDEALAISDRIAVMSDGRIEQVGSPHEVYMQPANRFVAEFVGKTNLFSGRVTGVEERLVHARCDAFTLCAERSAGLRGLLIGDQVDVCIRPEDVFVRGMETSSARNTFTARVEKTSFLGGRSRSFVRLGDVKLEIEAQGLVAFKVGETIHVEFPMQCVKMFHSTGETAGSSEAAA